MLQGPDDPQSLLGRERGAGTQGSGGSDCCRETAAGWMFCMSNKRDFHIIMVTMLSDVSAQDNVLQEQGVGGGLCPQHSMVLVP